MKTTRPLQKIILMLIAVALLPVLLLTAKQWLSLRENEQLIGDIYRQRLENILFSVNQYSWDVVNNWASQIIEINRFADTGSQKDQYDALQTRNPALWAIFSVDTALHSPRYYRTGKTAADQASLDSFVNLLKQQPEVLHRLQRYQETGYRKLHPLRLSDPDSSEHVALVFSQKNLKEKQTRYVGMVLEPQAFIRQQLFPKLEEIAGDQFLLSVIHEGIPFSYSNEAVNALDENAEYKEIWLFPDYQLAIRQRGQSLESVARDLFISNLLLGGLLLLAVLGAGWFIYRTVRREMELTQLKTDFVSNISHELRTPLSLIRMYTETLEMGRVPDEARKNEYYRIIGQETERLTHLVNNILNFSRIEAGRKQYHLQPLALNDIVTEVLDSYRFHLQNKGFTVEKDLSSSLPQIQADPNAVSEALINLIDNGIKDSESEKWLKIATGLDNGKVFLGVSDRGIGIDPDNQERIFEKFHRVADPLVHNTKGSGLGLSLVKHIAEAHGGTVTVNSQPGKGSYFRIYFGAMASKSLTTDT